MARKPANDQGHIIEAIKEGNRHYVWQQVKFVGVMDIQEIDERFLIFNKTFDSFDPHRNNNFIYFYKNNLKYARMYNDDRQFTKLTTNRNVINRLKSELSTPTENNQPIVNDFKEFMNMKGE